MPITYQRLGNSGGGMDLEISAYPNTEIKLSGEKNTYIVVADEKGKAIFKNVKSGKYTVTTNGKSKEITVLDRQYDYLCEQIKDIKKGSKLKLTNGKKLILMAKNVSEHEANTATFVSEFITDQTTQGYSFTADSDLVKILNRYASELADKEKTIIKEHEYDFILDDHDSGTERNTVKSKFYILSLRELGIAGNTSSGVNLGFDSNASRIKKYEGGSADVYFTRDSENARMSDGRKPYYINCIDANGKRKLLTSENGYSGDSRATAGIVPACDISQDAYVALGDDGYYRILGM